MNTVYAMPPDEAAAELTRLQALADQAAADARKRAEDERKAGLPAGSLRAEIIEGPDDAEIIALVAEAFGLTDAEAVERLAAIDFEAARERLAA